MYCVGVCCYMDPDGMKRLLESVKNLCVICVVCRWEGFEYDDGRNNEMIEIIKSYPNTVLVQADGLPQFMARNLYLKCADVLGYNAVLILDTDEYLESGDVEIPTETNAYNVIWNNTVLPRFIVNPKECYYKDRHNQIWSNGKELFGRNIGECMKGLRIIQDKSLRKPEREEYQTQYNLANPTQ